MPTLPGETSLMSETVRPLSSLVIVLSLVALTAPGLAQMSSEQPGALLIFPRVVRSETEDTILQVSNTTGRAVNLRCFYTNGAPDPDTRIPLCSVRDFQIRLTRQQPTSWVAGSGAPPSASDGRPEGLHPGPIPPLPDGFLGELRCVVVDAGESPESRNAVTGSATIVDRITGDARRYEALAARGLSGNDGDNTLLLDDAEYGACPRVLILNHFYEQAPDPVSGAPIRTGISIIPCSANLERGEVGSSRVLLETFNEFEQRLSGSLDVSCYGWLTLTAIDSPSDPSRSIFHFAQQGTLVGQTRLRPGIDASVATGRGVLVIGEERRGEGATTAINPKIIGGNLQADVFTIPALF